MGVLVKIADFLGLNSETGAEWPPQSEKARLDGYAMFKGLFDGLHEEWLDERNLFSNFKLFIAVNLPRILCTIPADLMLGEPVTIKGDDTDPITEIWDRNAFQTTMYENAIDGAHQGDMLFLVDRAEDGKAVIRTAKASTWFPVFDPDNIRDVKYHKLAWEREARDGREDKKFLRVIEHHKGQIVNRLFLLKDGKIARAASDSEWRLLYADAVPQETVETGVDDFLLVHAPNFRTARSLFGRSDFDGLESLFSALDARFTQIDVILGKHSDPTMAVPERMFQWLQAKYGEDEWANRLDKTRFVKLGENGEKPEYVTWDGQLEANFKSIDALVGNILAIGEVDKELVQGLSDTPVGQLSGSALRIKLIRTLAKVNRKWQYMKPAAEQCLNLAMMLEGIEDPPQFELEKSDGLPGDRLEDIQASRDMIEAKLSSRLREIAKLHDLSDEEAQELLDEIDSEQDTPRIDTGLQNRFSRTLDFAQGTNPNQQLPPRQ